MIQVTVLMPIYNAEHFLHDSIGSLLAQTSDRWKLICIDDGSTDNSRSIVEEYCKKDSRIKLICQENAGPAVARARAIEIADTEYVAILDSDDAYAPDYVEKMMDRAEETDADIIVPDVEVGYGGTQKQITLFEKRQLPLELVIRDGRKAFAMTLPWQLHGWQMVKTSLAKEYYTIQQTSYSKFNSDEYITRLLYLKSVCTVLCSAIYRYRMDASSITRKPSIKMMDYLKTNAKLLSLAEEEHLGNHIFLELYNDYYVTCRDLKNKRIPCFSPREQKLAYGLLRNSLLQFKENFKYKVLKKAPLRTKVKFALFLVWISIKCEKIGMLKKLYWILKDRYITSLKKTNCWKAFADIRFHDTFGRNIDWKSPRDLNEWINYFSVCTDTSLWVKCADKYAVRDYVKSKGLEHILVPLLGKWNQVNDIDFSKLPNEFVMKPNNGCYDAIIVKDKDKVNVEDIRRKMKCALAAKFGYESGEIHYLKMQPCVIAEQLLHSDSVHGIIDYKIWCFYGKPCGILVCFDRDNSHHKVLLDYYSLEWERQDNKMSEGYRHNISLPRPKGLEKMIAYAKKLSEGIPQVRVDFYDINGTVYFGEMTFTSCQGRMNYFTPETLVELGQKLKAEKDDHERKK